MGTWLVGRTTPADLSADRLAEMRTWLQSLGVDPTTMAPYAAVEHRDNTAYLLHLAQHVLRDGKPYLNVALDQIEMRAVTLAVQADSWPAWLTGLNCERAPRDPPP